MRSPRLRRAARAGGGGSCLSRERAALTSSGYVFLLLLIAAVGLQLFGIIRLVRGAESVIAIGAAVISPVLIVFIPTIGDYVTPELMLGSGGRLMSNLIQAQFLQLNNWPLGAALSIITMLAVGVISFAFIFLNRRWLRGR